MLGWRGHVSRSLDPAALTNPVLDRAECTRLEICATDIAKKDRMQFPDELDRDGPILRTIEAILQGFDVVGNLSRITGRVA